MGFFGFVQIEFGLGRVDWFGGVRGRRVRSLLDVLLSGQSLETNPALDEILVGCQHFHFVVLDVVSEEVGDLVAVVVPPSSQVNLEQTRLSEDFSSSKQKYERSTALTNLGTVGVEALVVVTVEGGERGSVLVEGRVAVDVKGVVAALGVKNPLFIYIVVVLTLCVRG